MHVCLYVCVCMRACMYICVHVCVYIRVHAHKCMYAYIHPRMYACIHVSQSYMYLCIGLLAYIHHVSMYVCMYACMYACLHTYIHACMYACTMYIYTYILIYRTYIHSFSFTVESVGGGIVQGGKCPRRGNVLGVEMSYAKKKGKCPGGEMSRGEMSYTRLARSVSGTVAIRRFLISNQ